MINEINSKIGVSFYLKKMSHDNSVTKRAVYATIAYAGTSAKMKTGFVCADPKMIGVEECLRVDDSVIVTYSYL